MTGGVCDWCRRNPADPRLREVTGIEELRAQGGANVIHGRRETGRQICRDCYRKVRDGIPIGQEGLPL